MKTNNVAIRRAAKERGVKHWQIAEHLKMQDSAFSRMLRHELPEEQTTRILSIIDELSLGRGANGYRI